MLNIEDAIQQILTAVQPLDEERISLLQAVGRTLSQPILAKRELPAWDNSAMDGYALRAEDVSDPNARLNVVCTIAAGCQQEYVITAGETARIFTGAPMPLGTDTVMIQENAKPHQNGQVSFVRAAKMGENVRYAGSDIQKGQQILAAGRILAPGDINCLAAQGNSLVLVHRQPRVTIVSTGSELCAIDDPPPARGQIVDSNSIALAAAVQQAGGIPTILPSVPDNKSMLLSTLNGACSADAVITCGGMSVGDYDHMRSCLQEVTNDGFAFWKVAIKPGKPLGFGMAGDCAVFGLPGNPTSALVTFEIFVKPALRKMMGQCAVRPFLHKARLASPIKTGRGRTNYLRASLNVARNELWVDANRNQSSGSLLSLTQADALVVIPPDQPPKAIGDWVDILLLTTDIRSQLSSFSP